MRTVKIFTILALIVSFWGCSRNESSETYDSQSEADSTSAISSSSAAVETGKDSNRRFIRTAKLKFKVKSVIQSTYNIEGIANLMGGFVTYTNITSDVNSVQTTRLSADSSLETTKYTVTNTLTIRVPNTKLDTTLKLISKNIDFLDYRLIEANDVSIDILSNQLTQKRGAQNEDRLTAAIDSKGKKLTETTSAEELLLRKKEQSDNAYINNLTLNDKIKFSTITISIYQRPSIRRELIENEKNIDAYEPGFGSKMLESIKSGWSIFEDFAVFLTKLWGFAVFAIVIFIIYKKYKHKLK